ncbi:hypothetical protein SAMN02745166_04177 [Prosthecobacter debontii]|uniref:Uncharacterized protein n=1 Tax=Prosthecobacter debontii TaxID=48467 RepID=A0A1T4YT50_9BACT|nr:hypothetical protein [Prosthecobacter debontii]SKB04969.1 hypothetical protein SAMN02745166_04177 [Prosthecobacter debontii]
MEMPPPIEANEPAIRQGKNRGGCLLLVIATLLLMALAAWFFIAGRTTPPVPDPGLPSASPGKPL